MDIVCLGLMLCDIIAKPVTPELFSRDSTPIDRVITTPGGDASNVAINVSALGLKSAIVSVVGRDANGSYIKEYLKSQGVDVTGVAESKNYGTGTSIVMVEPNGERHFLSNTEIFKELYPYQVTKELLRGAKILSLGGYYRLPNLDDGGVIPVFKLAHELGVLTSIDTTWNRKGNWIDRIEETLYYTDIFLPSYDEAVQITGEKDVRKMSKVLKKYNLKIFGVKMGDQGSYITDFKDEYIVKPFPVQKIINTVGAGDSYVAGFLSALVLGLDIYESALFASATAAHVVQNISAVGGVPDAKTILKYIDENRKQIESF